uniref:transposase n=1 Tax=Glaesserella sp. TaxID=2094731 RepID=UPI0035A11B18
YPDKIRCDNGSEFTSHHFKAWADKHEIRIDYIEPGSPYQNGFIERFNRTYREEVLDPYLFQHLAEVQNLTADWLEQYNNERPHESLGHQMTPSEYRTNNNVYF